MRRQHEFTGHWPNFGPYGDQAVHFQVCCLRAELGRAHAVIEAAREALAYFNHLDEDDRDAYTWAVHNNLQVAIAAFDRQATERTT